MTPTPMTDRDVDAWFGTFVDGYMFTDLTNCIEAKANYGVALMLVSYTEVLGGLKTGNLGLSNHSRDDFNAGLKLLDEGLRASEPSAPSDFYSSYSLDLDGSPEYLYSVLRCGLVHEYFTKGLAWIGSAPTNRGPGQRGVGWQPFPESGGQEQFYVNVNAYFDHFKSAAECLRKHIKVDPTGRAKFTAAVKRLESRKLKRIP